MKVSIKAMRVNKEMTLQQAAPLIGVNPATLNSWENNKTFPTAEYMYKICDVYSCTLDDIILPKPLNKTE